MVLWWENKHAAGAILFQSRDFEKFRGDTYVEAGRVEGALVGDAGGRVGGGGVLKVALLQQALSLVNDGFHHRNRQGHGGGERDDARQEAEDHQDPLLRGRDQREINLFILNICTYWSEVCGAGVMHTSRVVYKQDKF